ATTPAMTGHLMKFLNLSSREPRGTACRSYRTTVDRASMGQFELVRCTVQPLGAVMFCHHHRDSGCHEGCDLLHQAETSGSVHTGERLIQQQQSWTTRPRPRKQHSSKLPI